MYYAKMHCDDKVVAENITHSLCSKDVDDANIWNKISGSFAPYYITTINPVICSNCNGNGYHKSYSDKYICHSCEGTGYSINFNGRVKTVVCNYCNNFKECFKC